LFSLRNNDDLAPFKAPLRDEIDRLAISRYSGLGPTFGRGPDMHIADNAGSTTRSFTYFGDTYQPPPGYTFGETNTNSLLAGSFNFSPSETEALYIIETVTNKSRDTVNDQINAYSP
jgi:hypothetical protein